MWLCTIHISVAKAVAPHLGYVFCTGFSVVLRGKRQGSTYACTVGRRFNEFEWVVDPRFCEFGLCLSHFGRCFAVVCNLDKVRFN